MLTENIFKPVLIDPIHDGVNKISIVSGYATSAMAFHHLNAINKVGADVQIDLIVGMCPLDGISFSNHRGFQHLVNEEYKGKFQCSYIMQSAPVHSKLYIWHDSIKPVQAFIGSANYTQFAFRSARREALAECDPRIAFKYFESLISDTIYCTHNEAESFVRIYADRQRIKKERQYKEISSEKYKVDADLFGLPQITLSFLSRGNLPPRSGLNWGQRPEQNREPNQAYIPVPASVCRTDFFPEKSIHFTVLTDDGKIFTCTREQDNGKAVATPHNNSLLGECFRYRLGVPFGELVRIEDLEKYGRTDVIFYKIDDETYYMDFSVY